MNLSFFLYRRLAKYITCRLRIGTGEIVLNSKYNVASLQDVFCGPFYWQLYSLLASKAPKIIVDAGANVGHFSILANCCVETKYGSASDTKFYLIEPNEGARHLLERNLANAGMSEQCTVLAGLLGKQKGSAALQVDSRNYLTSSVVELSDEHKGEAKKIPYLDLNKIIQEPIDVLKIDIEGSEYDFFVENTEILSRTKILLLELHQTEAQKREEMLTLIREAGLAVAVGPIPLNGQELFIFERR